MIDRVLDRFNSISTTNARILVSIGLAAFGVIAVLIGILFRNWLPTSEQITVLKGVGLFLCVMMGIDLAQFTSKRFSDSGYAAAKNPSSPSPVTVEAPSTVSVTTPPATPDPDKP